jgi:dolichyl-phosphate-mannose-protein mannosyltransferase
MKHHRCYHHQLFSRFQGQYFSGGNFRIYLLGNPVIWWSNLVFLAMFLLMFFIAAIKQQRGYDADEKAETKSK